MKQSGAEMHANQAQRHAHEQREWNQKPQIFSLVYVMWEGHAQWEILCWLKKSLFYVFRFNSQTDI